MPAAAPPSYTLSTTYTAHFVEASGSKTTRYNDDQGHWYIDWNYAQMCTDGSTAVMMYYWSQKYPGYAYPNVTGTSGSFAEPYTASDWTYLVNTLKSYPTFQNSNKTTYWTWNQAGVYARGYMFYISMLVSPGGSFKGLDDYHKPGTSTPLYPTTGADPGPTVEVLDWESSNHSTYTSGYWYFIYKNDPTLAQDLQNDVSFDVGLAYLGVQIRVDAYYLTNWAGTGQHVGHAVTIVGYNNSTGTYTFIDTYGPHAGEFTQSQSSIVNAIQKMPASPAGWPADGGFIW